MTRMERPTDQSAFLASSAGDPPVALTEERVGLGGGDRGFTQGATVTRLKFV